MTEKVSLRRAEPADAEAVWRWRNEPDARAASRHAEPIPLDEHDRWFERRLGDPNTIFLIVGDKAGNDVGYVRFDLEARRAEISIALEPAARGKGLGVAAIRSASHSLLSEGRASTIQARIKTDNEASVRAFRRAGYCDGPRPEGTLNMIELTYREDR